MRLIEEAMVQTKGNKKLAAKLLGLKRTTLINRIKSLEKSSQNGGSVVMFSYRNDYKRAHNGITNDDRDRLKAI